MLNVLDYFGLFAIIMSEIFTLNSIIEYWVTLTVWNLIIVGLLGFAILRIRKYSKLLVKNKIFMNECLMITHLSSFACFAIAQICITVLVTITDKEDNESKE